MPPLLERQDGSDSESDDDETKPARVSKRTITRPTRKGNRKKPSVQKPTAKAIQTNTNTFVDKSSDNDVFNERTSDKSKIDAMEKATRIMSKCIALTRSQKIRG